MLKVVILVHQPPLRLLPPGVQALDCAVTPRAAKRPGILNWWAASMLPQSAMHSRRTPYHVCQIARLRAYDGIRLPLEKGP